MDADGYTTCEGDCDDENPNLGPWDNDGDSYSVCDGDCRDDDSSYTPRTDNDGDGVVYCDDCDDNDPSVFPGSAFAESDEDCLIDVDGDGWGFFRLPNVVWIFNCLILMEMDGMVQVSY